MGRSEWTFCSAVGAMIFVIAVITIRISQHVLGEVPSLSLIDLILLVVCCVVVKLKWSGHSLAVPVVGYVIVGIPSSTSPFPGLTLIAFIGVLAFLLARVRLNGLAADSEAE